MHTLETQRLLIRIETLEEYTQMFATSDDETLQAYFGLYTEEALAVQQAKVAGGFSTYRSTVMFCHLVLKETGAVIGSFSYHNWYPCFRRSEVGYDIRLEEHKNKGYMKEAVPAIIAYGFETMDLNRMEVFIDPENMPSRKLVEASGFQYEGLLRERYLYEGKISDCVVYALLAKDYRR